jgi:hypothetical protein
MNWSARPFIEYLNTVDETLVAYYGVTSDQDELEFIKQAHEKNVPPDTTALRLKARRP